MTDVVLARRRVSPGPPSFYILSLPEAVAPSTWPVAALQRRRHRGSPRSRVDGVSGRTRRLPLPSPARERRWVRAASAGGGQPGPGMQAGGAAPLAGGPARRGDDLHCGTPNGKRPPAAVGWHGRAANARAALGNGRGHGRGGKARGP